MDIHASDPSYVIQEKISLLKDSISPLAAVLLIADYSHPELEQAVDSVNMLFIRHMDIRFKVFFQLLINRKNMLNSTHYEENGINIINRYNLEQCDFKRAMSILNKSKGTVESLILNKEIRPINHTRGKKRYFITEEIINYSKGLK